MYQDNGLILATAQAFNSGAVGCNSGAGGLNEQSVNLALDAANVFDGINISDMGPTGGLELSVNITTAFDSATKSATNEWRLVALPIALSLLDNGGGGASDGKVLSKASVALTDTGDYATITGHNLPLGAVVFLTALSGTTGVSNNVPYFVIPTTADRFQLASSLANAIAGTALALTTNGTATVNFVPYVLATTGPVLRDFCGAGVRLSARVQPVFSGPTAKRELFTGQTVEQPRGAAFVAGSGTGGGAGTGIVPHPGRYLALQHAPSATMTAGVASASLVLNSQTGQRYYPTSSVVQSS